jgi:putative transposase
MCKRERRIDNLVAETHWKSIGYLLKEYDAVFLGDIESQGVLQGKLNGATKNELQSLSFYRFKQRLLEKAQQAKKMVFFTHEAYTSKTCTYCGTVHEVKSSKTYECPSCTAVYDRDEGAARNIYMKTLLGEGVKFMSLTF